jgi:hypothetical protein
MYVVAEFILFGYSPKRRRFYNAIMTLEETNKMNWHMINKINIQTCLVDCGLLQLTSYSRLGNGTVTQIHALTRFGSKNRFNRTTRIWRYVRQLS